MATTYRFSRGYDVLSLTHDGRVLITGQGEEAVVQRFASGQAAREHLEGILLQRRRSGYRIETEESELEPGQVELDELSKYVHWDGAAGRMTVTFRDGARALCPAVIGCAEARRPACLRVVCDPGSPGSALAEALLATPLPSVRRFVFDTPFQTLARQRDHSPGDVTDLLRGLPGLELAYLSGELMLRPCRHERLRGLWLLGDPLMPTAMSGLGRCGLPALERLGLALRHERGGGPERPAARALQTVEAASLRAVEVEGVEDVAGFLELLLERPLPGSWQRLYVRGGVDDEDALVGCVERHAAALCRLAVVALPLCDGLSGEAEERVRRWIPGLVDCEEVVDPFLPASYEAW